MAGEHWAYSVRRRRRLERIILVVAVAAISIVGTTQIGTPPASAAPGIQVGNKVHTVVRGESLSRIAQKYKTTTSNLVHLNKISNPNRIREGSRLIVPGSSSATVTTVKTPTPATSGKYPSGLRANSQRMAYDPFFNKWADANGIPRDLLKAICYLESGWNNSAVSSTGARGIGQILPSTSVFIKNDLIGKPELNLAVPEENIRMSARYVAYLIKLSGGDTQLAIAAYYQGYGSISRGGMRPETVSYVKTVFALRPSFS